MNMWITSYCLAVLAILLVFEVALSEDKSVDVENGYDPGLCDKSNHGKLKLVKNREDDDRLVICSQEKGVYKWKSTDGSFTLGEFISPGYDCSDILNQNRDAKDGFYWIHLNEKFFQKVWCDMKTDGGGFMLFGFLNSSVPWKVPSNNKSVDPFGSPRWSSVLGNTPILDFRVQISTSKNFKDSKADWSFRLKKERPLKNLMVMGEKGCDSNSPGIGDIKHVKDLKTDKIVSTSFRCSKFGVTYHRGTKFGWANMNSCLQRPCHSGYAFINDDTIQIDFYGAFSYRTKGSISGTAHNATAFIGCDKGTCCACYGPVGGTNDYCTDHCRSINGGTVAKNAFVWFWVRSTVPKTRVWRKCMEYQSPGDNGQLEWHKFIAGDATPVKGRCTNKEPRLSRVVVVPDEVAFDNIPHVAGLLAFRNNTDRLYLRSGSSWRMIAEENKVNSIDSQVEQLQREMTQEKDKVANKVNSIDSQVEQLQREMTQEKDKVANKVNSIDSQVEQLQREMTQEKNKVANKVNSVDSQVAQLQREMTQEKDKVANKVKSINSQILKLQQMTNKEKKKVTNIVSLIDYRYLQMDRETKAKEQPQRIRLSGGHVGRVEVYHPSHGWGTVCDDLWDINDGKVVCRQLGFSGALSVHSGAHYGAGTGPILLDNVGCSGSEKILWHCSHPGWKVQNCQHSEDAGVECFKLKIRLSGITRGRVEVYHSSYGWGTVCDDNWDINDGHVACRQLGYSKATATYNGAHYGKGTGPILLDDLICTGSESNLWGCPHSGWNVDNCGHGEDASVDCE